MLLFIEYRPVHGKLVYVMLMFIWIQLFRGFDMLPAVFADDPERNRDESKTINAFESSDDYILSDREYVDLKQEKEKSIEAGSFDGDAYYLTDVAPERVANFQGSIDYGDFRIMLPHVSSAYDLLRLQYGHWMSDEDISDYLSKVIETARESYSDKWIKHYSPGGSDSGRKEFEQTWRNLESLIEALDKPYQHFDHVRARATCQQPRPVVFKVSQFYHNASVLYIPSDVLLHRCDSRAGCCEDEDHVCVVEEKELVKLPFYTLDILQTDGHVDKRVHFDLFRLISQLQFINHTRCECQPLLKSSSLHQPHVASNSEWIYKEKFNRCSKTLPCPEPFFARHNHSRCWCDCFHGQLECLQVKRGKKPLAKEEQRCVSGGFCQAPVCKGSH